MFKVNFYCLIFFVAFSIILNSSSQTSGGQISRIDSNKNNTFTQVAWLWDSDKSDKDKEVKKSKIKNGVKGKVFYVGKPMENAFVVIDKDAKTEARGMPFKSSDPTDQTGDFEIELPPGEYYLYAKKKLNISAYGPLLVGDYFAKYDKNPIKIEKGKVLDIGNIELTLVAGDTSIKAPDDTGVKGKTAVKGESGFENVYVYVYPDNDTDLKGPSYIVTAPVDDDGNFKINLPEGKYYIAARKRQNGKKTGALKKGDYNVRYAENPVEIQRGKFIELKLMTLKEIDEEKFDNVMETGYSKDHETGVKGIIVDEKGRPMENMYAFVYKETQSVGKPVFISTKTKKDGKFDLYLTPGTFYLGVRSKYSGPVEVDEYVGYYQGTPDHMVKIEKGKILNNIKITARIWASSNEE